MRVASGRPLTTVDLLSKQVRSRRGFPGSEFVKAVCGGAVAGAVE
jgi:hypothetical protein